MPNSVSVKFPLTPAERSRLYRQRVRPPRCRLKIRVSDATIKGLVQRGYLGPDESDDHQAIRQALSLFVWDALPGAPRQTASKAAKRLGIGKVPKKVHEHLQRRHDYIGVPQPLRCAVSYGLHGPRRRILTAWARSLNIP
jgi:hypothetical protein